jgi:hypothetical protein
MPGKELQLLAFVSFMALASADSFAQEQSRSLVGTTDLRNIVLSPAPLGPPAQFAAPATTMPAQSKPALGQTEAAVPVKVVSTRSRQKATVAARKPKANPLNAYARDVRPQIWPCTGGGICQFRQ